MEKLETERLILRPLSSEDIEAVYEYNQDYEVIKFMHELSVKPGEKFPREKTFDFLLTVDKEWKKENPDFFEFAVIDKSSDKLIGNISCYLNDNKKEGELGWILNRNYHGKGYATEAASALKEFCKNKLALKKIVARCDERNKASKRVMDKIGMKLLWEHGFRKYPNTGEESTELMCELILN